ncbi:HLA class II histocompatibility antigen, DM beta chain-like [Engraulis encrasicolus]|uniref:HLA class II histocompatibility antigen, DM beta chain-like n=1 Tax=Engraulis encrasicolus TaxID=184585 RepID=UPI002FD3D190
MVSASHGSPGMVQCSVYGFYPRQIRVSWRKNGQEVTTDVTSTQVHSNGNWSYQAHSKLVLPPDFMDTVSCVVEHASFPEPVEHGWVPSMSSSHKCQIIIGVTFLGFGALLFSGSLLFYLLRTVG